MKKIYNILSKSAIAIFLVSFISCEITDLDQQQDPSILTPVSADPELLLNNIQLEFIRGIAYDEGNEDGLNPTVSEFTRMTHLFGPYTGSFTLSAGILNRNLWLSFYEEVLIDIQTLIPLAEERELIGYEGVAKVLQAYTYVLLVDAFGDVPYTEALQGNLNANPKADSGKDIYDAMLLIIDEAISDLNAASSAVMPNDLFYEGDKDKWLALARTLKFKMYVQMRLTGDFSGEINQLINAGLIDSASEDFQFQYGTSSAPAESRHPSYAITYDADGAGEYMTSYYVNLLRKDKGFADPRLRYYFYRQTNTEPEGDNRPCEDNDNIAADQCYIGDFYWTRPHGFSEGVPPDNTQRTIYGLYPYGGAFDDDSFQAGIDNPGAGGAGIFPIMLSSYVKFLQAESALMSGTTGDPKSLLEEGVRASMEKVLTFKPGQVPSEFESTTTDVENYVTAVLDRYDAAADNTERLDVIIKEYYIALWGNGIEAWNNYRRTSMPSDLSDHVETSGAFPRSLLYPATEVNSNSSLNQKPVTVKVFWDTNPDNLD